MTHKQDVYTWAVIGAGPAGIAVIGQLLDRNVDPKTILWIDPNFTVGDFGSKWRNVPSNTRVGLFTRFLQACAAFDYAHCPQDFSLNHLDAEQTCALHHMLGPLQWVTQQLQTKVHCETAFIDTIQQQQQMWQLLAGEQQYYARQVVLAIGAEPKAPLNTEPSIIPLEVAMDAKKLVAATEAKDVIAVFGSSHSAILALRNLLDFTNTKHVINFYRSPLCFAVYLEQEILFDDSGLKGIAADWARSHIHGNHATTKLTRVLATADNIKQYLPQCQKAIYATGFQRRSINIDGQTDFVYNDRLGIIAPGLFGVGIAFPEAKLTSFGMIEYRVGLWKFMDYITRVLPIWMQYPL